MRIFVIDDEPIVLKASEKVVRRALPEAEVKAFGSSAEALMAMKEPEGYPDVALYRL